MVTFIVRGSVVVAAVVVAAVVGFRGVFVRLAVGYRRAAVVVSGAVPVVDAVVTAEPVPLAAGAAEEAGVSSLGRQADRDKTSRAERPAQTRFIIEESSFGKG